MAEQLLHCFFGSAFDHFNGRQQDSAFLTTGDQLQDQTLTHGHIDEFVHDGPLRSDRAYVLVGSRMR